jgi:hypothetical protein
VGALRKREETDNRYRGQGPLLQVKSLPAGVSIGVGALRKREETDNRYRGHGPLLQVKSLPAGVSIGVGALRKREQINHQNRGHDPSLQLLVSIADWNQLHILIFNPLQGAQSSYSLLLESLQCLHTM